MDNPQTHSLKDTSNPSLAEDINRLSPTPKEGHFDELRGESGSLLPQWQTFFESLGPSGLSDLDQRTQELNRQIRDNGITYNVYADEFGP